MKSFSKLPVQALLLFILILFGSSSFGSNIHSPLRINQQRLVENINRLAEFGKNAKGGVSRIAYSEYDKNGRAYVLGLMSSAGLETKIDKAGNLLGRLPGKNSNLKPIVLGSHIDTVPEGGNYDGIVGSLGAIEVIQTLRENGIKTQHPIEVIIFQNEEGGHIGSKAITVGLSKRDLDLKSQSGKSIREGITFIGGDIPSLSEVIRKKGDIAGYIELHIEQGGILETEKKQIGVVQGIVGIRRWNGIFEGFANHAGTTPMAFRQDALVAAAKFISSVQETVANMPGQQVGTVGKIEVTPGAPNVIPGEVKITVEARDLSSEKIDKISAKFFSNANEIAQTTHTSIKFHPIYNADPTLTDPIFHKFISDSCQELGITSMLIPSGAGHDAQEMAALGPMGMIFIPSIGGISHSPHEFSRSEDIGRGTDVLLRTLIKFDGFLSGS